MESYIAIIQGSMHEASTYCWGEPPFALTNTASDSDECL